MELSKMNLEQVEQQYHYGAVSESAVNEYLDAWNATPGRFTFAYLADGAIRQWAYPDNYPLAGTDLDLRDPIARAKASVRYR